MQESDAALVDFVRRWAGSSVNRDDVSRTLAAMTGPPASPEGASATHEECQRVLLDEIERGVRGLGLDAVTIERPAISPGAEQANLLIWWPAEADAKRIVIHAGIDCLDGRVVGGASLAMVLAQMKLLRAIQRELGCMPVRRPVYAFAADALHGGSGASAIAADQRLAALPVIGVLPTDGKVATTQPGTLAYRCELSIGDVPDRGVAEFAGLAASGLMGVNRQLSEETQQTAFPTDLVQANIGRLGPFGTHALVACDRFSILAVLRAPANPQRIEMHLVELLEDAMDACIEEYGGDKRAHHFSVGFELHAETQNFRIDFDGGRFPIGGSPQGSNAITKFACMIDAVVPIAEKYPRFRGSLHLADEAAEKGRTVLHGTQMFTPAHDMDDVEARIRARLSQAVRQYGSLRNCDLPHDAARLTFRRLADGFAGDPGVEPVAILNTAMEAFGQSPIPGASWPGLSDVDRYHSGGHPVALFGPGRWADLVRTDEGIDMAEIQHALAVSTLALFVK